MLKAYKEGIPVKDISDFIQRVMVEFFSKGKLVKKMVIRAHGAGLPNGYGNFHIGREFIQDDEEGQQKLERLRVLAPMRTFTSWLARPVMTAPCCGEFQLC